MFLTFLKTNGTKEQKALWLDGAQEAKYFGAYAQTELGHGSNVRGLETIATFDTKTDEFIIHSPTLTSQKWWPTGMYACTHAVVFANLVLDGKPCGVHGFMLQLRDGKGHLMPGVEVGEIGPKIIGGHTNIGYASFDQVRVPRFNMFSKLFKVTREGRFIAPSAKKGKIKNISMMVMRVFNVQWAARDLSKAAAIAVRYSCVRRQGFKDTTSVAGQRGGEHVIMDYRMQQYRTLKALSFAYSLVWNARYLGEYLKAVEYKISTGDETAADELPELHATCSGLKAFATVEAHAGIEECRKACGGQGFLRSSGIADLTCSFAEPVTVEGEQVILSLQVGRFLIKSVRQMKANNPLKGSVEYLLQEPLPAMPQGSDAWMRDTPTLVALLRDRARRFALKLEARFDAAEKGGKTFDEATNANAILAYKTAGCHSSFVVARNNLRAVDEYITDKQTKAVLDRLLRLNILMRLHEETADWMGLLTPLHADGLLDAIGVLLDEIRPDVVSLTDAFGFDDYNLKSTLGRFDGNVYEAIYKDAKDHNPLNRSDGAMVGWDSLKRIFDIDFINQGVGQRHVPAAKL